MCGIVGCFSREVIDHDVLQRMTSALAQRGPDAQGTYIARSGRIALGHTRLSIIDLSPGANQPFHSLDGRFVVAFNGEIYNYQSIRNELKDKHGVEFKTSSDTEVIAEGFAIWGEAVINKLEGMFSIIIIDQHVNKMFLIRDRIGKKPLFYFQSDKLVLVASEIKSLLKHPGVQRNEINKNAISDFLHLGYIPAPHTIYGNIQKFPAGGIGEISESSFALVIRPYWKITEKIQSSGTTDYSEAKTTLKEILKESVIKRLISDVPLGAFLSGGIDSSLVTAIASANSSKVLKTFSIGFQEDKFDESIYAERVAKTIKTDHRSYMLHEKEAVDLVEAYLDYFDEPFGDTSAIPTMMVSMLAKEEVTVALTGDGGDELFQGYGAYTWADRLDTFYWKAFKKPLHFILNESGSNRFKRVARLLEAVTVGGIRSHIFSQEQYLFSQKEIKDQLQLNKGSFQSFEYDESALIESQLSAGEKQALFDFQYYLPDDLLVKVDRASMHYGLECRSPLLDHHLVEFAMNLDLSFRKKGYQSKFILKDILSEYLPSDLIHRQKKGFSVPLSKWMKGDLRHMMDIFLDDTLIESAGLVNLDYTKKLKSDYLRGEDYLYNRLWMLIVLHKWWKDHL